MSQNKTIKKKVGLALGGGGWRGISQIGVLKVLEKNNIPVDFIAGTSIGALVGGLYDYFGNADELEKFVLKFGYRDLFKTTLDPKLRNGLLNGKRMVSYIDKLTAHADIEDLKIPFYSVTTDLLSAKTHYIKKGNLAEAIRASISIPLVFQPVHKDNMCLIDGGATENIPVKAIKDMGADFVIAVSVNTAYFPFEKNEINSSTKIAVASARAMLYTLSDILSSEADVVIEPKIPRSKNEMGIGYFMRFVKEKDIVKIGEEATEKLIPEIKRKLNI